MADKFPLVWPEGWKRTPPHLRRRSNWKVTDTQMANELVDELRRFETTMSVISSNIPRNPRDGSIKVSVSGLVEDPGVAVYYSTNKWKERVIACDRWVNAFHNMYAIARTIDSLRAIERAGASQILDQAFSAFGALPASANAAPARLWWEVFGMQEGSLAFVDAVMCEAKYRELARKAHPDQGGSEAAMSELNRAREDMRRHFGAGS